MAKAGTSPVEALNKPGNTSSHNRHVSSSSSSERGSLPPASLAEQKRSDRPSKDYYSTFKPFYVRAGVEVAPINRFLSKNDRVKQEKVEGMDIEMESELSNAGRSW